MGNKKYIVRNCPCYLVQNNYYDCWVNPLSWCQNIDDCLTKRIIERCKVFTDYDAVNVVFFSKRELAKDILSEFKIEEINE